MNFTCLWNPCKLQLLSHIAFLWFGNLLNTCRFYYHNTSWRGHTMINLVWDQRCIPIHSPLMLNSAVFMSINYCLWRLIPARYVNRVYLSHWASSVVCIWHWIEAPLWRCRGNRLSLSRNCSKPGSGGSSEQALSEHIGWNILLSCSVCLCGLPRISITFTLAANGFCGVAHQTDWTLCSVARGGFKFIEIL